MTQEKTGVVLIHGHSIFYGVRGEPDHAPLLLLMGNGCGSSFWPDPFCDLLARGSRRVIRFDYRDTGQSVHGDFEQNPYTLDDLAKDAFGVLDALRMPRAHLVGLSMGGFIAQRMALHHPERVASLTSMMSTPDYATMLHAFSGGEAPTSPLPPPNAEWMKALGGLPVNASPVTLMVENWRLANGSRAPFDEDYWWELQRTAFERGDSMSSGHIHRCAAERTPGKNLLPSFGQLTVPALFIQGSEDPIFSPIHAEAAARAVPHGKSLTVDGMGHALNPAFFLLLTRAILDHTMS